MTPEEQLRFKVQFLEDLLKHVAACPRCPQCAKLSETYYELIAVVDNNQEIFTREEMLQ